MDLHEKAGSQEKTGSVEGAKPDASGKEKTKKGSHLKGFIIFLLGSMVIVFLTVWISVSRFRQSNAAQDPVEEEWQADSLSTVSQFDSDTVGVDYAVDPMRDSLEQADNVKMVNQIYSMRNQLASKENEVNEIMRMLEIQRDLASELAEVKQDGEQKGKDLKYYQETLPENIAKKLTDYQKELLVERERTAKTEERRAAQQRAAPTTAAGRTGSSGGTGGGKGARQMVKIYESMRPETAAPIIAKLNENEIVDILSRMRGRTAAKIIAKLDPELAAVICQRIGRK